MSADAKTVVAQLRDIPPQTIQNNDDRVVALHEARALCSRLENPGDTVLRLLFTDPAYTFTLQVAVAVSLFQYISDTPKTTGELAELTSTDPSLLRRIIRHLAAQGTISESGRDLWTATPLSNALAQPDGSGTIRRIAHVSTICAAGPAFFKSNGYKNPTDWRDTVYQHAFDCPGITLIEHMQRPENADAASSFNSMMAFAARYRVSWTKICPPCPLIHDCSTDPDAVAFVDIGGGLGLHIGEFRALFPQSTLPARVVLQELPAVIAAARTRNVSPGPDQHSLDGVELQEYDFWTPQPLQGAKIYFMSRILHDWPDEQAMKILSHVAKAMKKGYSKLLVMETVIPDQGCHPLLSGLDLNMMVALASKERSEGEWRALLGSQGLQISKMHMVPTSQSAVLEVELEG